ncbi:MAG: hypothetical protein H0T79_19290 [Deltaproteobacteria bacterium]|nr:hypothetical protein [Deltaproteobacteria bacterium]
MTKPRVAGHSIHPMLVGFPIAFYTATLATLIAYLGTGESYWYRTAFLANVIGLGCGLVAMIPGAIDLFRLPAYSAARRIGIEHASAQLFASGLFAAGAFVLGREWSSRSMLDGRYALDAVLPLVFVATGFMTMIIGAALGHTLSAVQVDLPRATATPTLDGEVDAPASEDTDGYDYLDEMPTRPISAPRHGIAR